MGKAPARRAMSLERAHIIRALTRVGERLNMLTHLCAHDDVLRGESEVCSRSYVRPLKTSSRDRQERSRAGRHAYLRDISTYQSTGKVAQLHGRIGEAVDDFS
jgi:hypothetical protein